MMEVEMRCESCGTTDVTVIGFESGDKATYTYCRTCEKGTWVSSGHELGTEQMLTVASRIEPGRRRAAAA